MAYTTPRRKQLDHERYMRNRDVRLARAKVYQCQNADFYRKYNIWYYHFVIKCDGLFTVDDKPKVNNRYEI